VGEGLIGHVATSGKTVRIDRNYEDPNVLPSARAAVRREQIHGFVCVPIHSRGRVLGTLSLGRKTVDQFDREELVLLQAAADQIGIALDNARLYSELLRERDEIKRAHAQRIRAETQLIHAEKLSAVGELASGVAHEINNPLTTILGLTHLLLTHPETTSHVRDRLGIVAEEAGRAARIVQNLLLFARHYTPERRPCSLADQAQRVLELIGYQLHQDNIRVVTDFAACSFVWADENQLQQVLLNLVQNAHQAMSKHPANRVLTVRVWPSDRHAHVEVRDTGPGIPPEVLPRIFDPFFTTKPVGKGTGLGLSQVHGFAHQAGGSVDIDSALGRGTVVRIRLPRGQPAEVEAIEAPSRASAPATVLLVEDNPAVADASTGLLEQLGYSVRWVPNAETALEQIEADGIDVVFSDIIMPGKMDGLKLARAIREKNPDLPILLTTGYSDSVRHVRADFPVLRKPYQLHELSRELSKLTGQS
jgi:signal transduction histidine kinase